MRIKFPSCEFDEAVAAVCHSVFTAEQAAALNDLLRSDHAARDEYLLRVELHARLASDPDLFAPPANTVLSRDGGAAGRNIVPLPRRRKPRIIEVLALAACLTAAALGLWTRSSSATRSQPVATTSKAVAMLNSSVDARWGGNRDAIRLGAPLEPGRLRLESGLAQIVFYSGARVVLEGPADFQLISRNAASCHSGRILTDVPPQARGFRVETPVCSVIDLGTSFGMDVNEHGTELHVFKGKIELERMTGGPREEIAEGAATLLDTSAPARRLTANPAAFASLFALREKSAAAERLRYDEWRVTNARLDNDSSLLVRFDFEKWMPSGWQIRNLAETVAQSSDGIVIGCQRGEGRWPQKRSLEFQSVSDRVRLNLPGEFESLTLAAWISVKGLDRKINSLFMCDGFQSGTVHWFIRNDGVPGITVIGADPRDHQIVIAPPVLSLDKFGSWLHLAAVLDGPDKEIVQYLNGVPVSRTALKISPPFRIGEAELGNWNPKGFPEDDPFMIRNFSGAMDEVSVYSRALHSAEIRAFYEQGKPQGETADHFKIN